MRWKLLTRGENSSRRLILLRTATFYSLGLYNTQTRVNLAKWKFKTFVGFVRAGQVACYLLFHCALQIQSQKVDSLSMKGMAGGYIFLSIWVIIQHRTEGEAPLSSTVASFPLCALCIVLIINKQKTWREKTQPQLNLSYCWYTLNRWSWYHKSGGH